MRAGWFTTIVVVAGLSTAAGCIDEFEAPTLEECRLDAPAEVALDEAFAVEVRCVEQPAFVDFDFGDDTNVVRTSAMVREHAYGADAGNHTAWRIQAFVVDQSGDVQRLETTIARRF